MKTSEMVEKANRINNIVASVCKDTGRIKFTDLSGGEFYNISGNATSLTSASSKFNHAGYLLMRDVVELGKILEEWIKTPADERKTEPLYYVKLPSGHLMTPKAHNDSTVDWTSWKNYAGMYTLKQIENINPLYLQFKEEV